MRRIAIITARGGSKRIPRKNVRSFCGKPILAYSVAAALECGLFDRVMVSTDDEEIAGIAVECGAEVPFFRSEETANDFAATADVLKEVLQEYGRRGERFDTVCCVYPTAPFLTAARLAEAVALLEESGADSVLPVVRFGFPPQRCLVVRDGFAQFRWPEYARARSQDLEPFYHDAGQFYCLSGESFREQGRLVMERTAPLVLSEAEVQDIDTEEDWRMAEVKFELLGRASRQKTVSGETGEAAHER